MKEKKVKVNISISPKTKALAQDKIDMFGGNFSAYVAHLILKDVERQMPQISNSDGIQITGVAKKSKITQKLKKYGKHAII